MPWLQDIAATRKLRAQPSSHLFRFFSWRMQPPQSVIGNGILTSCRMPGCSRSQSS